MEIRISGRQWKSVLIDEDVLIWHSNSADIRSLEGEIRGKVLTELRTKGFEYTNITVMHRKRELVNEGPDNGGEFFDIFRVVAHETATSSVLNLSIDVEGKI